MDKTYLPDLMKKYPQFFGEVLSKPDDYRVQVILTRIRRNEQLSFTTYTYNLDEKEYFYPASTVKFPIAILALQKLKELNIDGVDRHTTMITESADDSQTEVYNDPTSADGRPSIAHYVKKIFLVSDNDASNRLYEFLGQEYLNETLQRMGYKEAQILHRLSISLSEKENRHTNPIRFVDTSGNTIYFQPAGMSDLKYDKRKTFLGQGYISSGRKIDQPFDFSYKNRIYLSSLHNMMKALMFPESVPVHQRFNITEDDREFLKTYMGMYATESDYPSYQEPDYWPTFIKFLLSGDSKLPFSPDVKIYNKSGQAYGFLTDVAYVIDESRKIEFILSATIHCNSDGVYNDDHYDYESIGFPFLANLGRVIYQEMLSGH